MNYQKQGRRPAKAIPKGTETRQRRRAWAFKEAYKRVAKEFGYVRGDGKLGSNVSRLQRRRIARATAKRWLREKSAF